MTSRATSLLLLAVLACGSLVPRVAAATPGKDACTGMLQRQAGTTTTITVNAPGTWCLDHDLVESADALDSFFAMITVDADDVTIDCRGHRIEYSGTADFMYGIGVSGAHSRVTVRNCHTYGFSTGIGAGSDVTQMLVEDNSVNASRPSLFGDSTAIEAYGSGIIRRNRIHDAINRGITAGFDSIVADNLIDGITNNDQNQFIQAIDLYDVGRLEVRGNTVRGMHSQFEDPSLVVAVQVATGEGAQVRILDNVFVGEGVQFSRPITCLAGATRFAGNVLAGFEFISGSFCVDAGDNDLTP